MGKVTKIFKKNPALILVFLFFVFLLGVWQLVNKSTKIRLSTKASLQPPLKEEEKPKYLPGEIIVKFADGAGEKIDKKLREKGKELVLEAKDIVDISSIDRLNNKYKVKSITPLLKSAKLKQLQTGKTYFQLAQEIKDKHPKRAKSAPKDAKIPNLLNIYLIEVEDKNIDIFTLIKEYMVSNSDIVYAEPNYKVQADSTIPNDTLFPIQWPLNNTGQDFPDPRGTSPGTPDADIDAPEVWDIEKGEDVVIAVIDTGVDYNHRDLSANIWTNSNEIANDGIDNDNNGYIDDVYGWDFFSEDNNPLDDQGHGTFCAGTIGANTNNNQDVAGINWQAKIMALKFLDAFGFGESDDAMRAFYYATDNGARITSNSYGGSGYSQAFQDVIDYAFSQGVLAIASAGNDNINTFSYPAAFNHVIAVAATDSHDQKAVFSNYGYWVDLSAPGVDILSLRATGTSMGTLYDEYTTIASGTSMACPHVAGLAGLILSRNPGLTPTEVEYIMENGADDLADFSLGFGRINAIESLTEMDTSIPPKAVIIFPPNGILINNKRIEIKGEVQGGLLKYRLEYSSVVSPDLWNLITERSSPVEFDLLGIWQINRSLPDGSYNLRLTVETLSGKTFFHSIVLKIDHQLEEGWPIIVSNPLGFFNETIEPLVVDLDNNGTKEIIVLEEDGISTYSHKGELIWKKTFNIPFILTPAVGDIDFNYPGLEIVFPIYDNDIGKMIAYHADGTKVSGWPKEVCRGLWLSRSPIIADLNKDRQMEIIFADMTWASNWTIFVWDGQGNLIDNWPITGGGFKINSYIGDVTGDEKVEIIVENGRPDYTYRLFDYQGNEILSGWPKTISDAYETILGDINKDQKDEIIIFRYPKYLTVLKGNGETVSGLEFWQWPFNDGGRLNDILLSDFDSDALPEILVRDTKGRYGIIKENGSSYVSDEKFLKFLSSRGDSVGEIDKEKNLEIAAVGDFLEGESSKTMLVTIRYNGNIFKKLTFKELWAFSKSFVSGQPVLGNFDNDANTEILVIFGPRFLEGNQAYLYLFDLGTPLGRVEWGQYRYDEGKTNRYVSHECDRNKENCDSAYCRDKLCNGSCWNLGGEVSDTTCCGDDSGEYFNFFNQEEPDNCDDINNNNCVGKNDNPNDKFCCSYPSSCVFNGSCYPHGVLKDLDKDGLIGELCLVGRWYDPDRDKWTCLGYTHGEICQEGLCWVNGGEVSSFGEYNTGTAQECCGDDGGEYIVTQNCDSSKNYTKCCDNPDDKIDHQGNCVSRCPP